MRRLTIAVITIALLTGACRLDAGRTVPPSETATTGPAGSIPSCDQVEQISAAADAYRDSPIYVGDEMPTDEVRAWAAGKPGFEEIWSDREHLGWITLAFSVDADARQAELAEAFPDVGVVAVGVDWTMAEFEALQARVMTELSPLFPVSSGILPNYGVVEIGVAVLKPDRIAAVEARFAGERVCIVGADPADVPADGPQASAGDGWRLLADEYPMGQPYRTGIAADQASYEALWAEVGMAGAPPAVDFETEIVIWFGAVYGGSCPNLRLDDVVVDPGRAVVHADIVLVDPPMFCTDDARPHAYVVAVERAGLPTGPFIIQLDADGPPAGAPEERTVVHVDLSRPGAIIGPGEAHPDPSLPEPHVLGPGAAIDPGGAWTYRLDVHCGIEWLGKINGVDWRTDIPAGVAAYLPPEWRSAVVLERIEVSITLEIEPDATITATVNGHSVIYRPTAEGAPRCV